MSFRIKYIISQLSIDFNRNIEENFTLHHKKNILNKTKMIKKGICTYLQ